MRGLIDGKDQRRTQLDLYLCLFFVTGHCSASVSFIWRSMGGRQKITRERAIGDSHDNEKFNCMSVAGSFICALSFPPDLMPISTMPVRRELVQLDYPTEVLKRHKQRTGHNSLCNLQHRAPLCAHRHLRIATAVRLCSIAHSHAHGHLRQRLLLRCPRLKSTLLLSYLLKRQD